jgi:hypothetical protein
MVAKGVRHLALLGRSEPAGDALATIGALQQAGIQVVVLRGDVSVMEDAARVLNDIDPLKCRLLPESSTPPVFSMTAFCCSKPMSASAMS